MADLSRTKTTIATVERETGLSKDTLRVWERRYRFPLPARDGHGERVYPPEQVDKLRVIRRLLDRGLRPGQLVRVPLPELLERFEAREPQAAEEAVEDTSGELVPLMEETLALLKAYDETGLRAQLSRVLLRVGLHRFIVEFAALMNVRVGNAWSRGDIAISQEHLYTEQMQHLLRQGIGTIYLDAQQPTVLLTTLPGEEHQLGLLMAHACLAAEGARCISLGVQTPAQEIADAARERPIDIIGLSFSETLKLNVACEMLKDLRARVPNDIEIWAGGRLWARARGPLPGVRFVTALTQIPAVLADWRARHGLAP